MTVIVILLIAAAGFIIYAWMHFSKAAIPGQPLPSRIWASVVAAVAAIGAAIAAWIHGLTGPPLP